MAPTGEIVFPFVKWTLIIGVLGFIIYATVQILLKLKEKHAGKGKRK